MEEEGGRTETAEESEKMATEGEGDAGGGGGV